MDAEEPFRSTAPALPPWFAVKAQPVTDAPATRSRKTAPALPVSSMYIMPSSETPPFREPLPVKTQPVMDRAPPDAFTAAVPFASVQYSCVSPFP